MKLYIPYILISIMITAINIEMNKIYAQELKVVYIEASTGNRWKLQEFPQRTGLSNVQVEFHAIYDFDKTNVVNKILDETVSKPDIIIIQECAVYFPAELSKYEKMYERWMLQIKSSGITPVVATTIVPAQSQGLMQDIKDFIKVNLQGKDSQYDQIVLFNMWLRDWSQKNSVQVLDLAKALQIDETNFHMADKYNSGDGIHVNSIAYEYLDELLYKMLKENSK